MDDTLVWKDPPPHATTNGSFVRHAALAANPGRWLLWSAYRTTQSASSAAGHIRKKHPKYEVVRSGVEVFVRLPLDESEVAP